MRVNPYGQPIGDVVPNWSPRPHPGPTELTGRHCRLEPVHSGRHHVDLYEAYMEAPDDRDWTYLFHERPASAPEFCAYLTILERSEDPLHFAIIERSTMRALGTAALMRIDPAHGSIEVGSITFAPRLQRTAAGSESMYLLMRHAFDELGYRRYEWKCDSLNTASRRAAERYGFSFEGIFRNAIVYKGRNRDTAWYSITDQEWPRVRAGFETWLDPANFDERGQQKRSLQELRPRCS
jgi:RimJ/RimL family protein N-acetyltransferase